MKSAVRAIALAIAVSAVCPALAVAEPQVSLNWHSCTGPIELDLSPPTGVVNLYASVIGMTDGHTAYQVWIKYGDYQAQVPDAWRFDNDGCQTPYFLEMTAVSNSKACPPFQGASPSFQVLRVADFWPPEYGYPTSLMRVGLGNIYPDGVGDPDPLQRYQLVRFLFDHSFSVNGPGEYNVSCGGFETPLCIGIGRAVWVDPYAQVHAFAGGSNGQTFVTFNGGGGACGAVPARASTWGSIKAQYRM